MPCDFRDRSTRPWRVLSAGALLMGVVSCFTPLERTDTGPARLTVSIVSREAAEASANDPVPFTGSTVDLRIDGLVNAKRLVMYQRTIRQDSLPPRLDVGLDLTPCLDFVGGNTNCPLFVSVRLRNAAGQAYDSAEVGPVPARPGAQIAVPTLSFRPAARIQAVDSVVRVGVGKSVTPRIVAYDAGGNVLAGRNFTYRTLNPGVATVDAQGVLRGVTIGSTTLEASRENRTVSVPVTVPIVDLLTTTPATVDIIQSQRQRLAPTISVAPGRVTRVTWRSANPAIVTVDTTGLVTSVGAGTTSVFVIPDADTTARLAVPVTVQPFRSAVAWRRTQVLDQGPVPGTIAGLYGTRLDSIVGVGCNFIARFNGSAWRQELAPTFCPQAITGTSMQEMWALGSQIWRFANGQWTRDASLTPAGQILDATTIGGFSFAVGGNGTILIRDAVGWKTMSSPTTRTLRKLSAVSPTLVYAVGDSGTVIRYDGTRWSTVPSPLRYNAFALLARSANDIYVYATAGPPFVQELWRFDGTSWSEVPRADGNGMGTFFMLGTDVYIAGYNGVIMRLENGRFELRSPREGWAYYTTAWTDGQTALLAGPTSTTALYRGTAPQMLWSMPTYEATWAISPNAIYFGGYRGFIDFFDGTTWRNIRGDNPQSIASMWGDANGTVWAGGTFGTMLRIQGTTVTPVTIPSGSNVTGIFGVHRDTVWAVTDGAEVLRWNGTTWTLQQRLPFGLRAIHGSSSRNIVAVGFGGGISRWNGTTWTTEPSGVTSTLQSVYVADSVNTFVVGDSTLLQRTSPAAWRQITIPTNAPGFRWVRGSSARDVWVSGCTGLVAARMWRFDGTSWFQDASLSSNGCDATGTIFPGGGMLVGGSVRQLLIGTGPLGNTPGSPP